MPNFGGVYVAVPACYTGRGEVAEGPLRDHLARLADRGVDGFAILATPADALLSREEQRNLVDVALDEAEGERVLVGLPPASTREAYALARHASDRGASALLVAPPVGLPVTLPGFRAHVETLAQLDAPLLLGDAPGSPLQDPRATEELCAIEGVAGIIELDVLQGVPPGPRRMRPGFSRFTADPGLLAFGAEEGPFSGVLSELANLAPDLVITVQENGPSPEQARLLNDTLSAFRVGPQGAALRHLLRTTTGLDAGHRLPLLPLTAEEEETVERLARGLLDLLAEAAEP